MSEPLIKIKYFLNKEKCSCGSIATWSYMPGTSYYCENCVPRGCSCEWNYVKGQPFDPAIIESDCLPEGIEGKNWKWIVRTKQEDSDEIKSGEVWVYIDDKGRESPCCEFWYKEDGWDKDLEE